MAGVGGRPGDAPDGQRGGGAGGAVSPVEESRACRQGAEEAAAESSKHPGRLAGLLSCSCRYVPAQSL